MKKIQTISLFPSVLEGYTSQSMMWKAAERQIVDYEHIDLREFGLGPRRQVDDTPYGGGDGMLLRPEPIVAAIEAAKSKIEGRKSKVILMTPRGKTLTQARAKELAESSDDLIFICPRYEGYDERIVEHVDEQISIGKYILTGGELPALVVIDSVVRLLPGVLGGAQSAEIESFSHGDNLEFPQYTRPAEFQGEKVPDVLLNGNHAEIARWREEHSK